MSRSFCPLNLFLFLYKLIDCNGVFELSLNKSEWVFRYHDIGVEIFPVCYSAILELVGSVVKLFLSLKEIPCQFSHFRFLERFFMFSFLRLFWSPNGLFSLLNHRRLGHYEKWGWWNKLRGCPFYWGWRFVATTFWWGFWCMNRD